MSADQVVTLTSEEEAQFTAAFKTADKRRTGTIPIKSLRDVLETVQKSALTNQQFYVITADADVENSGVLEIGEFLQCCLAWKKLRTRRGQRRTKEVVDSLTSNGPVDPEKLDAALAEFDLDFSVAKKMKMKNIAMDEAVGGLSPGQLTAVMRKTGEV